MTLKKTIKYDKPNPLSNLLHHHICLCDAFKLRFGGLDGEASRSKPMSNCKTCQHWKNHQMLLNYQESTGFCINPKFKFNTKDGRLIGIVDRENLVDRTKVTGCSSHDFETMIPLTVQPSRYMLQTEEQFGCIYFEENKKPKTPK